MCGCGCESRKRRRPCETAAGRQTLRLRRQAGRETVESDDVAGCRAAWQNRLYKTSAAAPITTGIRVVHGTVAVDIAAVRARFLNSGRCRRHAGRVSRSTHFIGARPEITALACALDHFERR